VKEAEGETAFAVQGIGSAVQVDVSNKIMWWQDRQNVLTLISMQNTSASTVLKWPKGGHDKQLLSCRTAIINYNQYKGGVDLTDQQLSYYSLITR